MTRQNWRRIGQVGLAAIVLLSTVFLASCQDGLLSSKQNYLKSYDKQIDQILADMTLEEKVGQMIQAENAGLKDVSDVENYYLGSLLSGGGSDPREGNSLQAWSKLYEDVQGRTQLTRLKIPLLYGIDAVHGHSNVLNAVIFPHNVGLGCTNNPELIKEAAYITAKEVRATGIQWTFAPCVTVPQDIRWGRTYEGFSDRPMLCGKLGAAAVYGFQGDDLSSYDSVLACAKHYVGDGGTAFGTSMFGNQGLDQGDVQVDDATVRRIHLAPYIDAINAGVGSIMPSYSSVNGVKCSANKYLLTTVLKEELGFEGFLISDYEAIKQIDPDFKKAIGMSINAGMDMAMEPTKYREFFSNLVELVNEGTVPMSRIDDAVRRILRVKFAMGMMEPGYDLKASAKLQKEFGSNEHRKVARQAVRESLVLLKNENKTLPLSKNVSRIHLAGKSADNIGNQCGGWTIHWQGASGDVTTGGTTLMQAVKETVSKDTKVTYSEDGKDAAGADVGLVVIGETPYAEGCGDRTSLLISTEDYAVIDNLKKQGVPVVVILYSGRPMIINKELEDSDAFVAAWLPGTEGLGITDVLFGDYKPTGKLAFTWPASMSQVQHDCDDKDSEPLFKYGFGLSY